MNFGAFIECLPGKSLPHVEISPHRVGKVEDVLVLGIQSFMVKEIAMGRTNHTQETYDQEERVIKRDSAKP